MIEWKEETAMNTALDLAKYIVTKCVKEKRPISNLQLQKILYYIQKAFLKNGNTAFFDDIQAWPFGPVVPNVYYYFCAYGAMPISFSFDNIPIEDYGVTEIINQIVEEKRELDPWEMVAETHKRGGAWEQIYQNGAGNHKLIPRELIRTAG